MTAERPWAEGRTEEQYLSSLLGERRLFAWALEKYGGRTAEEAESAALQRYPYQQADAPFRGLIFHDGSWHRAMCVIHGDQFWKTHPELVQVPPEYRALD